MMHSYPHQPPSKDSAHRLRPVVARRFAAPDRLHSALCLILLLGLCGCIARPKAEKTTPLQYLNGQYYQSVVQLPTNSYPEPGEDRERQSEAQLNKSLRIERTGPQAGALHGELYLGTGAFRRPLAYQTLILSSGGNTVLEATTDALGRFEFSGVIIDGAYSLELRSEKYRVSRSLVIHNQEMSPMFLVAEPR